MKRLLAFRSRVSPAKSHAVADAAVIYVVLLDVAKGMLVLGGLLTFIVLAVLFVVTIED